MRVERDPEPSPLAAAPATSRRSAQPRARWSIPGGIIGRDVGHVPPGSPTHGDKPHRAEPRRW